MFSVVYWFQCTAKFMSTALLLGVTHTKVNTMYIVVNLANSCFYRVHHFCTYNPGNNDNDNNVLLLHIRMMLNTSKA